MISCKSELFSDVNGLSVFSLNVRNVFDKRFWMCEKLMQFGIHAAEFLDEISVIVFHVYDPSNHSCC